jgi:hypothetical protein
VDRFGWRFIKLCKKPIGRQKVPRNPYGLQRQLMCQLRVKSKEKGTKEWIHFSGLSHASQRMAI